MEGDPLSEPPEGTNFADTFRLDFQPPELQENKILLRELPSLWYLVTAALAK